MCYEPPLPNRCIIGTNVIITIIFRAINSPTGKVNPYQAERASACGFGMGLSVLINNSLQEYYDTQLASHGAKVTFKLLLLLLLLCLTRRVANRNLQYLLYDKMMWEQRRLWSCIWRGCHLLLGNKGRNCVGGLHTYRRITTKIQSHARPWF